MARVVESGVIGDGGLSYFAASSRSSSSSSPALSPYTSTSPSPASSETTQQEQSASTGGPRSATPAKMSKRAANKLVHKEAKKLRKHDDRLRKHENLLERARTLRAKLPHAIPPAAEYRNLASFTEKELLAVLEKHRECWAAFTLKKAGPGSPSCSSGGASAALLNTAAREQHDQHQTRSEHEDDHEPPIPIDILRVPTAAEVVGSFMRRPEAYHAKYAAQELSLAYQIHRIISQSSSSGVVVDAIIDVGAGNGNLSMFLALLFDVPVLMVEMDSPRQELRAECCILQHRDSDTSTDEIATASAERRKHLRGLLVRVPDTRIESWKLPERFRNVVVLGKHLCGPGTDAAIEFIRKNSDRVRGCAFATCCFNKIGTPAAAAAFAEWHRDEVEVVAENEEVAGVDVGVVQEQEPQPHPQAPQHHCSSSQLSRLIELAKMTSWRNTALTDNSLISADMLREAEYFESWMQQFRLRKLKTIFQQQPATASATTSTATEILYCNSGAHSQQNRCLIGGVAATCCSSGTNHDQAGVRSAADVDALAADGPAVMEFWRLVTRQLEKYHAILPIDLRPVGLVSLKFNFDGRSLLVREKANADAEMICETIKEQDVEDEEDA